MKPFDKRPVYESEIAELVHRLAALCYEKGIPLFCSVAVANTEEGQTEYKAEYVSPAKVGINLCDDQISRHVNVYNGYVTKLPEQPLVLDL